MASAVLTPWQHDGLPTREALEQAFRQEGLSPSSWSNASGERYRMHSHPYHKVLYCSRGAIRFVMESTGEKMDLSPGDRLDIPPGTPHSAVVGPAGVTCLEAARH